MWYNNQFISIPNEPGRPIKSWSITFETLVWNDVFLPGMDLGISDHGILEQHKQALDRFSNEVRRGTKSRRKPKQKPNAMTQIFTAGFLAFVIEAFSVL